MINGFRQPGYAAFAGRKPATDDGTTLSPLGRVILPTGGNQRERHSPVVVPGGNLRAREMPGTIPARRELRSMYDIKYNMGEIPTMFGNQRIPGM